ncbi:imsC-like protein, partial [Bacillus cereus]
RLPLEFTFSIKPTSSSVIIYTEVINRFKECYTGGGIQGFTIQFDKNTLASA